VKDVLEVMREFEPFEAAGVGSGLIAWELHAHEETVAALVRQAYAAGLIAPAGRDHRSGDELWQLTDEGRRQLAA
jgi:hypothetical protein